MRPPSLALLFAALVATSLTTTHAITTVNPYTDLFANPQHNIVFTKRLSTPEQVQAVNSTGETISMKTASGQQFLCLMPKVEQKDTRALQEQQRALQNVDPEQRLSVARQTAEDALATSKFVSCLLFGAGYWTYEFCPHSHIRQFHVMSEQEAASLTAAQKLEAQNQNYFIGRHQPDNEADPEDGALVVVQQGNAAYVRQKWAGGTKCDLKKGAPRSVEIQFYCNPQAIQDQILQIQETSTCKYLVVIHTSRLCHDPVFAPYSTDGSTNVRSVQCHPIAISSTATNNLKTELDIDTTLAMAAEANGVPAMSLGTILKWKRQLDQQNLQLQHGPAKPQVAAAGKPSTLKSSTLAYSSGNKKKYPTRIDLDDVVIKGPDDGTWNDIFRDAVAGLKEWLAEGDLDDNGNGLPNGVDPKADQEAVQAKLKDTFNRVYNQVADLLADGDRQQTEAEEHAPPPPPKRPAHDKSTKPQPVADTPKPAQKHLAAHEKVFRTTDKNQPDRESKVSYGSDHNDQHDNEVDDDDDNDFLAESNADFANKIADLFSSMLETIDVDELLAADDTTTPDRPVSKTDENAKQPMKGVKWTMHPDKEHDEANSKKPPSKKAPSVAMWKFVDGRAEIVVNGKRPPADDAQEKSATSKKKKKDAAAAKEAERKHIVVGRL